MTVEQSASTIHRQASRNNCINLLKCIACFGVVFIHVPFPGTLGQVIKYASTFAVPLFMMIAGYYSYGCTAEKIKKRLIKMTKIMLFAIAWWLAYEVVLHLHRHDLMPWLTANFTWKTPIKFFAFCMIDWAIPLWYLIAMAETYFVWVFVVKHRLEAKAAKLTWLLWIAGAVLTVVVDSLGLKWSFKINFLCRALPWFMIGYLVKERFECRLPNITNAALLCMAAAGWVITLSAVILKTPVDYNYAGVLLTAPSLFLIGVKNRSIRIGKPIEFIAEKLSLFIYIFHPLVSNVIRFAADAAGVAQKGVFLYLHPVITLAVTMVVAMALERVFRNRLLRKIIS